MAEKPQSVKLDAEQYNALANIAFYTPGATVAGLIREAVADLIKRKEKAHGGAFPSRSGKLPPGRRPQ